MEIAVVYMLAGLSSRFGGKAKGLIKVGSNGESLIEYSMKQALKAGVNKIIFVVSKDTKELFFNEFGDEYQGVPIYYALQKFNPEKRDKPWGTVDALCAAKEFLDCPFIVCNGDDIYGEKSFQLLVDHLKENKTGVTIGYPLKKVLPEKGSANRGIFNIKENIVNSVKEFFDLSIEVLEKKGFSGEEFCSMNLFGFHPEVIEELSSILKDFKESNKEDRKIECLLPEEINNLISKNKTSLRIYPTDEKWLGVTHPEDEERVRTELKNKS